MNITITTPTGILDARHDAAPAPGGSQAVLCHPHPQYGGSMHDAVLEILAGELLAAGVGVLRFNFRGVGASTGRYDGGPGEVEDLLSAVQWLESEHAPDALWLGGYSFGAYVIWQALVQGLEAGRVLLVAPPVGPMAFPPLNGGPPVEVFAGDQDDFIAAEPLASLPGIKRHIIEGADHFFSGHADALAERIRATLG